MSRLHATPLAVPAAPVRAPIMCDPSRGEYHELLGETTSCRIDELIRTDEWLRANSGREAQAMGYAPHACVVTE